MSLDRTGVRAKPRSAVPSLKRLLWLALPLFAAAALHSAAHAGAGVITTTVTSLQPTVTYTDSQPNFKGVLGYEVAIKNDGGNTVNNIVWKGSISVTDADETPPAFNSALGGSCTSVPGKAATATAGAIPTTVTCTIGQLKAGQPAPSITVFFNAPKQDAATPLNAGLDFVKFSGQTIYAEQFGGSTSPPQNSILPWATADVLLGTVNIDQVKSAVLPAGGRFFTGAGAVPKGADKFATNVQIPGAIVTAAGATYTTVDITEAGALSTDADTPCTGILPTCFTSAITAPGTFTPYLTITLRLDSSVIPNSVKIGSVLVYYEGQAVGDCASQTTPLGNGVPCIAKRTAYKNNAGDLSGDFEWTILNTRNGSYKIF